MNGLIRLPVGDNNSTDPITAALAKHYIDGEAKTTRKTCLFKRKDDVREHTEDVCAARIIASRLGMLANNHMADKRK